MAATPELLLPDDEVTARLGSLVFSWEPLTVGSVDRYALQIALDEDFTDIVSEIETTFTQVEVTFEAGNLYFWRVQAVDGVTVYTSTTVRSFSAPPFSPASVESHVEDGKGRILNQFKESD